MTCPHHRIELVAAQLAGDRRPVDEILGHQRRIDPAVADLLDEQPGSLLVLFERGHHFAAAVTSGMIVSITCWVSQCSRMRVILPASLNSNRK